MTVTVIVDRQCLVKRRAWQPLFRRLHVGERAVLEQQIDAHAIDQPAPALDKGRFLVAILVLQRERHADARQVAVAARRQHAEHRRLDLFQLVDAADLFQRARVTESMLNEIESSSISTMNRARSSSSVRPLVLNAIAMPRDFISRRRSRRFGTNSGSPYMLGCTSGWAGAISSSRRLDASAFMMPLTDSIASLSSEPHTGHIGQRRLHLVA